MSAIFENIPQFVLGLLGLSFLVFIHELGHFLIAKRNGVRIKVFSIGFGKKLFVWKHKETEYCISMIPFGGYVAMAGENPEEEGNGTPDSGDFNIQPISVRAAIAFGGPAVNIMFALVSLYVLFLVGVPEPVSDRLIVGFVEEGSAGAKAGIVPGDTILHIAGKPANGWDKFRETMGISLGRPMELVVARATGRATITVVPEELLDMGIGNTGIYPRHRIIIPVDPEKDKPAWSAGLRKGDTLYRVGGVMVSSNEDVVLAVNHSEGAPMEWQVLRGADTISTQLVAKYEETEKRWMVGIRMQPFLMNETRIVRRGPIEAIGATFSEGWEMATSIFRYLGRMVQGQIKLKALSGPVGIVPIIGLTWMESFHRFATMMALISMNLGVMNLLPLAITDGGILFFLGIEAVRGRPLSRRKQALIQQLATAFFIMFFLYITVQDIGRLPLFLK